MRHGRCSERQSAELASVSTHTSIYRSAISTQERVHHRGTTAKGACCVSELVLPPSRACASSQPRRARECSKAFGYVPHIHQSPQTLHRTHGPWPSRFLTINRGIMRSRCSAIESLLQTLPSRPTSAKTMLKQAALIAFASSAAMALQAPNLQALQRGLHTRLAASSRRRKARCAPAAHTESRAGP